MVKWSPWPAAEESKKLQVKVNHVRLEGFFKEKLEESREKIVAIEVRWKGPKAGLVSFYRTPTRQKNYTSHRFLRKGGEAVEWDEEFESLCDFSVAKGGSFRPWNVTFNVLYGESSDCNSKLEVRGKVSLDLAELASKIETTIERKLPMTLQDGSSDSETTLLVSVSFVEVSSLDSPGIVKNSAESSKEEALVTKLEDSTSLDNQNKHKAEKHKMSPNDSDESSVFDSVGSNVAELESFTTSEIQTDPGRRSGFFWFSWKRRRLTFTWAKRKESLTSDSQRKADGTDEPPKLGHEDDNCQWEMKEVISRDGQAKLKACVFFASLDQRSEKASGESACTALVTVIAHWLHSNQDTPTRPELDSLIVEGSSEWQKLCNNETYIQRFPDKHFDLDTVLEANLRPLSVLHEKSFIGFFCPEKFDFLKEAMSFDEIWNKISRRSEDYYEPRIYIVSWNDHFFVLKVEKDAYYIIDSLGERLFEGCNQAYILKFDDSSLIYGEKTEKREDESESNEEIIICSGKECCKEFIKRFLAAIPLRELEKEEKQRRVSDSSVHRRLQIEFHLTSFSSPSSSTLSVFSSEESV